jgi:hypothetical protein
MQSRTLAIAVALIVAAEACCCCTTLGGPEPPYLISPSPEAIDQLDSRMEEADLAEGDDGFFYFSIYMTEEEATSLLVRQLESQEGASAIEKPQIHFLDDRVEVYLTVTLSEQLPLPIMVALSPTTLGGDITLTLEELILGPLPLPESVVGGLGELVSQTVRDAFANIAENATLTDLQSGDGRLVLVFKVRPEDL